MLRCAKRCFPTAKCHGGRKFGWDEEIKEAKHEVRKDYCQWRDAGKPRRGNLFCGMAESRKRFKLKLKENKRRRNELFCNRLIDDIDENSQELFWKKLKFRVQHTRVKHNGQTGEAETEEEILEIWKKHFGEIINSESADNVERERLLFEQSLAEEVERIEKPWWFVEIHPLEVERACKRLKRNKAAGPDMVEAEHVH